MKGAYYAVHVGREPGIYNTWKEAESQILGYSGARFQKFDNIDDATHFLKNGNTPASINTTTLTDQPKFNDCIFVFTDGSFSAKTKRCGTAVLFDEPFKGLSISKQLPIGR